MWLLFKRLKMRSILGSCARMVGKEGVRSGVFSVLFRRNCDRDLLLHPLFKLLTPLPWPLAYTFYSLLPFILLLFQPHVGFDPDSAFTLTLCLHFDRTPASSPSAFVFVAFAFLLAFLPFAFAFAFRLPFAVAFAFRLRLPTFCLRFSPSLRLSPRLLRLSPWHSLCLGLCVHRPYQGAALLRGRDPGAEEGADPPFAQYARPRRGHLGHRV